MHAERGSIHGEIDHKYVPSYMEEVEQYMAYILKETILNIGTTQKLGSLRERIKQVDKDLGKVINTELTHKHNQATEMMAKVVKMTIDGADIVKQLADEMA